MVNPVEYLRIELCLFYLAIDAAPGNDKAETQRTSWTTSVVVSLHPAFFFVQNRHFVSKMPLPTDFGDKYGPWAVVTGASAGIGAEFVRQLATTGLSVVLVARRAEILEALEQEVAEKYNVKVLTVAADLSEPEGWDKVLTETEALDVGLLVNNAGIMLHGAFLRDDFDKHLRLINVNVTAVTSLAHAFGRRFAKRGRGGILFVSSAVSTMYPWLATYSCSKAYVSSLALILREEFVQHNISVTVLEPGPVGTEMSSGFSDSMDFGKAGLSMIPAEQCVSEALQAFSEGRARITPSLKMRIAFWMTQLLPPFIRMPVMSHTMQKVIPIDYRTYC